MENKNEVLKLMILLSFSDKEFHENEEEMIKKLSKHNLQLRKWMIFREIKNSDEDFIDMCVDTIEPIKI